MNKLTPQQRLALEAKLSLNPNERVSPVQLKIIELLNKRRKPLKDITYSNG